MNTGARSDVRAWLTMCGTVILLAVLAAVLPGPTAVLGQLTGRAPTLSDPVELAALATATGLVWLLLIWGVAVLILACLTRLPGAIGRIALRWLGFVLPRVGRVLVVATVGAGVAAGSVACAAPALAGTERIVASAASTPSSQHLQAIARSDIDNEIDDTGARFDEEVRRVDVDWPAISRTSVTPVAVRPVAVRPAEPGRRVNIDWPDARVHPSRGPAALHDGTIRQPVTVRPGDTLWSIARDHLPPGVSPAQIDANWRAWYSANLAVVGRDPDLLLPGQQLLPPGLPTTRMGASS